MENEFSPDYWVKKQIISGKFQDKDSSSYLLMGLQPPEHLRILVNHLRSFPNPLSGVQLWTVVLAQKIFKLIVPILGGHSPSKWSIILYKFKADVWQMIVCQSNAIVLCRQGPIEPNFSLSILKQEITTTLRYLNRNDYQEGEPVTVIQMNFKKEHYVESTALLKAIHLEQNFNETNRVLGCFPAWYQFWKRLKTTEKLAQPRFYLPELLFNSLAFDVPQRIIEIALPLTLLLFIVSAGIFVKNNYIQKHYNVLLERKIQTILPQGMEGKLKEIDFFQTYHSIQTVDPLPLLQIIGKIFPPYSVATELAWIANEASNGINVSKTVINIVVDQNLLNKGGPFKKSENFYSYQEKVRKELSNFNPLIKLNWGNLNNQQNVSLNIQCPVTSKEK